MKHVNVRLSEDVHAALVAMAEADDRSLNNMIVVLIKDEQQRREAQSA